MAHNQPHTKADNGGQRDKSTKRDDDPSRQGQPQPPQEPAVTPQDRNANASPTPGKDERRNRSV